MDPRSSYVELFWLPVLGPSSTLLLRRFADGLDEAPGGFTVELELLARSLGLGGAGGRHSPFQRAIQRCARYGMARRLGASKLGVRRLIAPVPERHLRRLPVPLQEQHVQWTQTSLGRPPERAAQGPSELERRLWQQNLHPALAYQAARSAARRPASDAASSSRLGVHPAVRPPVTI
jgi:hypothetical protein